ncbi:MULTISPECIES: hypothetical protein [unclassified Streptomyces]|uniref:hypothetical protein n=1 Tax=unclassified Streptomyces TaxID=2593676 RepID=UPI002252429C|nr:MULTISPECIES: hypothetical protein [unclassified Streptomyces]MCX4829756.1 hypothetical protein [Streptomyces sp. NBC_01016]
MIPPSPIGRAFGIVLGVASIIAIFLTFSHATTATGLFGTPGKFTVTKCVAEYTSHASRSGGGHGGQSLKSATCTGSYRSADGKITDKETEITLHGGDDGAYGVIYDNQPSLAANRSSSGELSVTNLVSVANNLCVAFFCLILLGYSITCAVAGSFPKKGIGPSHNEATRMEPPLVKATEEWLWVIGGVGLLGAIIFRIVLW